MSDRAALLIEDDRLTAAVLADWLRADGWDVTHVDSGADALARFAELRPSLVVCDLVLPGVDGATLCTTFRLEPFGDRLMIVLISSRAHEREAALAAGADAFLAKPIDREHLRAVLGTIARGVPPAEPTDAVRAPIRVPTVGVLEDAAAPAGPEEGAIAPGVVLGLLRRAFDERFTGVLTADGASEDGGALKGKIFLHNGWPALVRSSDADSGLAKLLAERRYVAPDRLAKSVEEARRAGQPLGEVLVRSGLIEQPAVEAVLRQQVLVRCVALCRLAFGTWTLTAADAMGLAGFDVHPAAIEWMLDRDAAVPPPDEDAELHVQVDLAPAQWALLDPAGMFGVARALVLGGATLDECSRAGGPSFARLLGLLTRYRAAELTEAPPPASRREAGLAELDVDGLTARIAAEHRALSDANHYTVLGLAPGADAAAIAAATASALVRVRLDTLPSALDSDARRRARAIHDRVLEAGRVLGDPAMRAIYDARLAGNAHLRVGDPALEDYAVLQAARAQQLFRRGEFVTAAALFSIAIQLEGESGDLLAMLGWARHRACPEDHEAGEAELRRALALDPEDEFALYYLGRLLVCRGEIEEGRRLLRAAIVKNHEFEPAREALRELGA
jgi:CheY-like chemotaxis protein